MDVIRHEIVGDRVIHGEGTRLEEWPPPSGGMLSANKTRSLLTTVNSRCMIWPKRWPFQNASFRGLPLVAQ